MQGEYMLGSPAGGAAAVLGALSQQLAMPQTSTWDTSAVPTPSFFLGCLNGCSNAAGGHDHLQGVQPLQVLLYSSGPSSQQLAMLQASTRNTLAVPMQLVQIA